MAPSLKDRTGQWGEWSVLVEKVKFRIRDGVGSPPREEECEDRGDADLAPELTTEVFILPESPGISCTSGNATCRSSCGFQALSFSWPSNSHVLDVGTQEQEVLGETR